MSVPVVLSIAGSDNCAGAGIQADLKTCSALGVYCLTVLTAVTAQNYKGVKSVAYVGDMMLRDQLTSTLECIRPDAVKIGMLPDVKAIDIIAEAIREYDLVNVVIDPVLSATCGGSLSGETSETVDSLISRLFPLATLITPNIPEMSRISGLEGLPDDCEVREFMRRNHINAILLKGGHSDEKACIDRLYESERNATIQFTSPRLLTGNTHGTGCTLSSAIASGLAKGKSLSEAISEAKTYVTASIRRAIDSTLFPANGPLLHFPL